MAPFFIWIPIRVCFIATFLITVSLPPSIEMPSAIPLPSTIPPSKKLLLPFVLISFAGYFPPSFMRAPSPFQFFAAIICA